MSDPKRWLDNPEASDELKGVRRGAAHTASLDGVTRARVGVRLGRLGAVPFSAVAWLSLKSAAALGLAGGATVAGTLAVVEHYRAPRELVPVRSTAAVPRAPKQPAPGAAKRADELAAPPAESPPTDTAPTLNPPSELPRAPRPGTAPSPSSAGGLAAESALLEQARRSLDSAPDRALSLVGEHARTFPSGQLAAERRLIEIDALYRVGRRTEARARAEQLLARGGDDLYVGRVRRLLQKINGNP
jgi:hypothetical protein